jgi:hypothetical protein
MVYNGRKSVMRLKSLLSEYLEVEIKFVAQRHYHHPLKDWANLCTTPSLRWKQNHIGFRHVLAISSLWSE